MATKLKKLSINYAKTLIFPVGIYLVFAIIALCSQNKVFFTGSITSKIFTDSVTSTIMALAIAIPLSGGRWDFAPGIIAILGGIIGINLGMSMNANVVVVLLLCIISTIILALIEGFLYIFIKVPNMIISLGIVMVYEALTAIVFSGNGVNIYNNTVEYTNELLFFSKQPWCYILLVAIMLFTWFLLYKTKFGADTKSLSMNPRIAINNGVNEKKNIILTYLLVGFLLGFVALLNACKAKVEPTNNLNSASLMYSSMASVLIGLFLANYSNMPWGILMGAIGMNVLTYGMQSFGIDSSIQTIITGIVIVAIMAYTANRGIMKEIIEGIKFKRKDKTGNESTNI